MPIQVIPYTAEWVPAVLAFNDRMHADRHALGLVRRLRSTPGCRLATRRPGASTGWRSRTGPWCAAPTRSSPTNGGSAANRSLVVDWQGPITEALIDRRWNTLGLRLLREMLKQYPLLYSWGHGGLEQPMLQMLEKLGWLLHRTPFLLRVLQARPLPAPQRPAPRHARASSGARRRCVQRRRIARPARAARGTHVRRHRRTPPAQAIPFERFEGWADELWERCAPLYAALACRDADTMNTLLPPGSVASRHSRARRARRSHARLGGASRHPDARRTRASGTCASAP